MLRWRVREIAEPERWTPRLLASAAQLAYGTVWHIWHNKSRRVDFDTLERLSRALHIKATDLLEQVPEDITSP